MSLEPELKFQVAKDRLKRLESPRIAGGRVGRSCDRQLVSTYFDTPKQKLHRHGFTLRVRQVGDDYIQTVKTSAAGSFARGEWEAKVESDEPDFGKLRSTPFNYLATKKLGRKLEPAFRTVVRRVSRPVQVGPSEIELALDRGNLTAHGSSKPIIEFELELKKGRSTDLFQIARCFERRVGAELDLRSKAEEGYRLISGDTGSAVRAEAVRLSRKMTASEAFNVIAYSTLHHFSGNADSVRRLDGEAIHQMRVGLRRLRAAISLFGGILSNSRTAKLKAELKWLTGELAPARELDVFVKERVKPVADTIEPKRGGRAIAQQFSTQREQAFQRARRALETSRYRNLLIDIVEWLEHRRSATEEADTPIGIFAEEILRRRIRKAHKQGRRLESMSSRERHKLRIRVKKIRYAVEFFQSGCPRKAQRSLQRLSDRLKNIQNALGALNDFIAHREIAIGAALEAPCNDRRARAFVAGLLAGQEREASKNLLRAAGKEIRRLKPPKALTA